MVRSAFSMVPYWEKICKFFVKSAGGYAIITDKVCNGLRGRTGDLG